MGRLAGRYLLLAAAVVLLNFLLPRWLPGNPLDAETGGALGQAVSTLSAAEQAQLRSQYRLDQPVGVQLAGYLGDLAHGDLGWSISRSVPVAELIGQRLPWTLALVLTATLVSIVAGSLLGLASAWRGGRLDRAVTGVLSAVAGVPEFLVAIALLLLLAVGAGWFPMSGGRSPFASAPVFSPAGAADVASHLVLPTLALVLATLPGFALLARGSARAVLAEPYLTTARAKGLGEWRVALGHAVPNALLPSLTLAGLRLGYVLGGAIVVERVFAVPGLGLLAFEAIQARDYPVLQAVFLLGSLAVLAANFGLELAYRRLEPRWSAAGAEGAHAA